MAQPAQRTRFLEGLTGRLTVGESYFFRNEHHFRALREHVLPHILREKAVSRELRIWSAGCSTGEEPYSVAIVLDQLLGADDSWRVSILGTDLNPDYLARAREGRYRLWSFRQCDLHKNQNYFHQEGDEYQLAPHIRDRVRFSYLNLVKDVYPSVMTGTTGLDLVLFRNVAIYLKPEVTAAILTRFRQVLRPGGWLLLGETEVSTAPVQGFEARCFDQATFYRTRSNPPESSAETFAPPALAGAFLPKPFSGTAPRLPDWVPLPKVAESSSGSARRGIPPGPADRREPGSSNPPPVPAVAWEQIERRLRHHEIPEAVRPIDQLPDAKERAVGRLRVVRELLAAAETVTARRHLEVCLKENPLLLEAHLLKAALAEEAGDLAEAERHYRRALYLDRACAMAHFHLALVQQQQGRTADAQRSVQTMLRVTAGNDPHALVEHGEGVCYGRLRELAALLLEVPE